MLEEKRHIKKEEIDEVIKDNPVVISHKSGHGGIFNTKALEKLDITINTKTIEGRKNRNNR